MQNSKFVLRENENGQLLSLSHINDRHQMNWVEGTKTWGTVKVPKGVEASVKRELLPNGNLKETYSFLNTSACPVFFKKTDVGIYTTFNDNYEDAAACMTQRCNTHIFCGEHASYVMALRMGGEAPHLGLILTEGSISCYSVERKYGESSNDRGDFILHPQLHELAPGQSEEISWELFWFEDPEDFEEKLLSHGEFPVLRTEQCTLFIGENISFDVVYEGMEGAEVSICSGDTSIEFIKKQDGNSTVIHCEYPVECQGGIPFEITIGEKHLRALFYGCEDLDTLVEKRCHFIAEKQQYHGKIEALKGAYLVYDWEDNQIYYSHEPDHNGGRERLAMGALIALALQKKADPELEKSLDEYVEYVYRELYDEETGIVYNDIYRNNDWHRLYNYPWVAVLQMEVYRLKKNPKYLLDAFKTMKRYYQEGGAKFYAIVIRIKELVDLLVESQYNEEAETIKKLFRVHADNIVSTGTSYPRSEVNYEQSIVTPAVSCLLQAYQIFHEESYLEEAKRQMKVLRLFNGRQPDYHQFETAIRHWDGYWFGKYRMFGDTYPHYWSALSGDDEMTYAEITGDEKYRELGKASLRGILNTFFADGSASCAMVFPETVNGNKANFYDPWANDQDWGLYFALKYEKYDSVK